MNIKKISNVVLVLFLMLSVTFIASAVGKKETEVTVDEIENMNLTGLPIVKEKVTLTAAHPDFWATDPFDTKIKVRQFEEKTNVHIEWEQIPGDARAERTNLMFASGDLPDIIFMMPVTDVAGYGKQGLLIALEDLIEKYAPNIKKAFAEVPLARKMSTAPDGHIYSLPNIDMLGARSTVPYTNLIINKVWLDKLGLSVPETTEDFYNVLKAFKDGDPNGNGKADEIPYGGRNGGPQTFLPLYGAFGVIGTDIYIADNGEVLFAPIQPGYKEAIEYMHRLYSEGLIDQEYYTELDQMAFFAKGQEGLLGALIDFGGYYPAGIEALEKGEWIPIPQLKGPKGYQLWPRNFAGIYADRGMVPSTNKLPEITIRWLDQAYSPKDSMEWLWGPFGINLKENPDGTIEFNPPPEGMTAGDFRVQSTPIFPTTAILKDMADRVTLERTHGWKADVANKVLIPYLQKYATPPLKKFMNEADREMLAEIGTDIREYVKNKEAEWVAKGGIEKEWDAYIAQLKKMKIDEYIRMHKEAYKAFMK